MRESKANPDLRMGSLEISRPVVGGNLQELSDRARHYGIEIFGSTESTNVEVEPPVVEGEETDYMISQAVGSPLYRAYDKLMLPLLKLAAPSGSPLHQRFYHAAGAWNRNLQLDIEQMGLQFDILDQNHIEMNCDALDLYRPSHKQGIEIVAKPSVREQVNYLFLEENRLILSALIKRSGKSFLPLAQAHSNKIPIGLVPPDTSPDKIGKMMALVSRGGPYRVILGAIEPPMVR